MIRTKGGLGIFFTMWALGLALNPSSLADPIQATYSTTGTIATTGITGTPIVSFQGVSDGTLTTGQPFSLGQFIVAPQPDGGTSIYETPFQITLTVTGSSADPALPQTTPMIIKGGITTFYALDGSHSGQLAVVFDSLRPLSPDTPGINAYTNFFTDGRSFSYGLYPTKTLIALDPTSQNGGVFDVEAELDVYNAPEPTTLALLLTVGMALFAKRYQGRARARRTSL